MTRLWDRRWAGAIVVGIAVALYLPTLVFGRVAFDDPWLWADDSPLRDLSLHTLHDIFFEFDRAARHPYGSEYLPVRDALVMLDMWLWGDGERGPHLTQLVLYAATVYGMGRMLIRFRITAAVAWVGTLLWAIHPIHVQSVAWLSERKGILEVLFVVCLGHAWVRYREGRSPLWLAAAALAAIAATWSKAPGMFGVAAIAALDVCLLPRTPRRWIALVVVGLATALAAAPVVGLAVESKVVGPAEAGGDRAGRVETSLGAQGHYVESMVLARRPALSYPIMTEGPAPIDLALGAAALVGSIAAAAWCWRHRARDGARLAAALLAWAWIWYVPIGHILAPVHIVVADRFALAWSLAACVGVAAAVHRLRETAKLLVQAALIVVLGIATIEAEKAWTSSTELYGAACASNPRDADACRWLAIELGKDGHAAEAKVVIDAALGEHPGDPLLLVEKAKLARLAGKGDEALELARQAAAAGTGTGTSYYASLLVERGRFAEALEPARYAARRHPETGSYQELEVTILLRLDRPYETGIPLVSALAFDPHPVDRVMLADVLLREGDPERASAQLDAVADQPALADQVAALRRAIGKTRTR